MRKIVDYDNFRKYTKEEIETAKSKDIVAVAEAMGFETICGDRKNVQVIDPDKGDIKSLVLDAENNSWIRWSTGDHGDPIRFVQYFGQKSFPDAIDFLLNGGDLQIVAGKARYRIEEEKEFSLPPASKTNENIIRYLKQERGLSDETIQFAIERDMIYESVDYKTGIPVVVFKGYDENGVCKFANKRGIEPDKNGKKIQKDILGNQKQYGIRVETESSKLYLFEAAIDMLSFIELSKWIKNDNMPNCLASGGTNDMALRWLLSQRLDIDTVYLCLDADNPGYKAANKIKEMLDKEYYDCEIRTIREIRFKNPKLQEIAESSKDWNDLLKNIKNR